MPQGKAREVVHATHLSYNTDMKKAALNIGAILVMVTVMGFAFNETIGKDIRKGHQLREDIRAQRGKTILDAKRTLGEPFRTTEFGRYKESLASYSQSLEPDPPLVECDQVLEYQQLATVGMLFIRKGTIVETYVGGT